MSQIFAPALIRQDATASIAKESGGNLATVKTNTDPLVASGGGGYVRQDSTATIAKESGGNLAAAKSDLDFLKLWLADGNGRDAFGRLKVQMPVPLFDFSAQYGDCMYFWENTTSGSGAISNVANQNAVRLTTGGTVSGAKVYRQSKQATLYQPGRSLNLETTFVMSAAQTNTRVRIGYFGTNNGIFLERSGSSFSIVRRTNVTGTPVDNAVAQASWSVDPMNGSGPSGINLDFTKTQIMFIQLQYLGVGRVQVGFFFNGVPYVAHEFLNTNVLSTVYMSTGSQTIRGEVENTGTAGGIVTLDMICVTIHSGGEGLHKLQYAKSNGITAITTGTTLKPILSIRAATLLGGTGGGGSFTNRGHIIPIEMEMSTASGTHEWQLVLNPTLTSPSWAAVDADSLADYDVSASAMTGGIQLDGGYIGNTAATRITQIEGLFTALPLVYAQLNGTQDILTVAARVTTGSGTALAALTWHELR